MEAPSKAVPVVLYSRVSTDDQAESGLGLADQARKLRAAAELKDWADTIELVDDGYSAKSLDRPAMAKALAMLEAGEASALVVSKLDRLTRKVGDLSKLMERSEAEGWALVILDMGIDTTTAAGKLVANMMGAVAQWERDVISERTTAALAVLKADGRRLGRPVLAPGVIRQRIARERADGKSLRAIASGLNDDQVPTAQGGRRWYASTIKSVLASMELDAEAAA